MQIFHRQMNYWRSLINKFNTQSIIPCSSIESQNHKNVVIFDITKMKVAQLCPTLCDPIDYTVDGNLQARILEWVAYPFSGRSSRPRNKTGVSCIAGIFFTSWATREALMVWVQFSSLIQYVQLFVTPWTPGFPVHHQHLELVQTHIHWIGDAIQPSYILPSPSPPAFNLAQHQGLF